MEKVYNYYKTTIEENSRLVSKLKKRIYMIGTIRLIIAVSLIVSVFTINLSGIANYIIITALFAIPFVVLLFITAQLTSRKEYAEELVVLCEKELKGLDYDFSGFDGASGKINSAHSFSLDLDLFGNQSVFQSLNRSVTFGGCEKLAEWMQNPLTLKKDIELRQKAINELSELTALRQHFIVSGSLKRGKKEDVNILNRLMDSGSRRIEAYWKIISYIVPAIWIVLTVGAYLEYINPGILSFAFIISTIVANAKVKRVNKWHQKTGSIVKILETYVQLIKIIEEQPFKAEILNDIKKRFVTGNLKAYESIRKISSILSRLDQRSNMLVAIINLFTLREIRITIELEEWVETNKDSIEIWLDALAGFDALCSLGGFAYNHPDYCYPQIEDTYFRFTGKGIGHPLMPRQQCVRNDISIDSEGRFMVVTGANMAGKSTYLRTVGVNYLLACVGAPVWAEELTVSPASLVTSLRTSDSLAANESYFFAELKRLKMIIDRLQNGEKLFIILDEILKGTNSTDKQKGSLALIRQFISYKTCGIIATHDLVLGSLQKEFPENIGNFRFEADISDNELVFTYKLREGIAENMNACFLMMKMGITGVI